MTFGRALWCVAILIGAIGSAPLAQAQDQADLGAIEQIRAEAFQRSQVRDTLSDLTDVSGPRLTGSPHLKAAAGYVIERLTAWRLQNPRLERWGPFGPGWSNDRFVALAISPRAYPLIAYPKAWTPGTSGDLTAEAVMALVGRESDFEKYRGRLEGKVVLTEPARDVNARFDAPAQRYSAEELSNLARQQAQAGPLDRVGVFRSRQWHGARFAASTSRETRQWRQSSNAGWRPSKVWAWTR